MSDSAHESGRTARQEERGKCWDAAVHCYGTAYIFEQRAKHARTKLRWLTYVGLAVPLIVGAVVLSFRTAPPAMQAIATIVLIGQLAVSLWSLVAKWDDQLATGLESKAANYRLATRYEELASNSTMPDDEFRTLKEVCDAENRLRQEADSKQDVSDREKMLGMRRALWKYRRPCAGCKQIPDEVKSKSDCDVCGR
jgi:mobilome CxxCx(11)CxxC protein